MLIYKKSKKKKNQITLTILHNLNLFFFFCLIETILLIVPGQEGNAVFKFPKHFRNPNFGEGAAILGRLLRLVSSTSIVALLSADGRLIHT